MPAWNQPLPNAKVSWHNCFVSETWCTKTVQ